MSTIPQVPDQLFSDNEVGTTHPQNQTAGDQLFSDAEITPSQPKTNGATIVAPSIAGHMPGVMDFGNKITPGQAAGGVAAGAVAGAIPLALSTLPGLGEALLSHAEEQAGAWAAKYPHLVALGSKIGVPTAATALLGWMIHQTKSSSSK